MEINKCVYTWLKSLDILGQVTKPHPDRYKITNFATESLENGYSFLPILTRTLSLYKKHSKDFSLKNDLTVLKANKNNASKKFNWAIIKSVFEDLNISIENDDIELIKAGSTEVLEVLLESIYEFEKELNALVPPSPVSQSRIITATPIKSQKKSRRKANGDLIIESLSSETPLENTESCVEFLLVSFCKHFKLHPKQAAGLLTQSGKYLEFLISRGVKGKHIAIIDWYQETYENASHLLSLMQKESKQGSIDLVLSSVFYGLLSSSIDTVLWTCRVLSKLGTELCENRTQEHYQNRVPTKYSELCWTWFTTKGLPSCLDACRKFGPYVKNSIISVIISMSSGKLFELFSVVLKEQVSEIIHFNTTVNEILPTLCQVKSMKEECEADGVFEFLIDFCIENVENAKVITDERLSAFNLICDVWVLAPNVVDSLEKASGRILKILEKASRDKSLIFRICCIGKLFQLLEQFTVTRNSFAPVIYKIITFDLVENYSETDIREFILNNFIQIFKELPEIPIKILLEPLIKQLKITEKASFTITEFGFFSVVCQSPKLTFKLALQVMDVLAKFYLDCLEYCEIIGDLFLTIFERFLDIDSFQKYLQYLLTFYLKEIGKPKKSKEEKFRQKAMMGLVKGSVNLHSEQVNKSIKFCVCELLIKCKSSGLTEWLTGILNIIGDPLEVMEEYRSGFEATVDDSGDVSEKITDEEGKKAEPFKNSKNMTGEKEKTKETVIKTPKKLLRKQIQTKTLEDPNAEKPLPIEKPKHMRLVSNAEHEFIKVHFQKNKNILEKIFKNYATSLKKQSKKIDLFASISETFNHITDAEFFQMLKDTNLSTLLMPQITFTELIQEYSSVNKKTTKKFNYIEFLELLTQSALLIFSKEPADFSLMHPVIPVINLVKVLKSVFKNKSRINENAGYSKNSLQIRLKKFNSEYKKNPNFEPPVGFKKVSCRNIKIQYGPAPILQFSESATISIAIFDEILSSSLKIHILEPVASLVTYYKIIPDVSVASRPKKIVSDQLLPPALKSGVITLKQTFDEEIAQEIGSILNEILSKLDPTTKNQAKISSPIKAHERKVSKDKANKLKEKQLEIEKKRLLRVQVVKVKIQNLSKIKLEKENELKLKAQEDNSKKKILIQRLEAKIENDRKVRLEEIEKWKKSRDDAVKAKELMESEKLLKEKELRIKRRDEFFKSEKERMQKLSEMNLEKKISLPRIEAENQKKSQKTRLKKLKTHKFELEKSRKNREDELKKEEILLEEFKSPEVQQFFIEYESALELLFFNYCGARLSPVKNDLTQVVLMKFEELNKLSLEFALTPEFFSQADLKKLYISIAKNSESGLADFNSFKLISFKLSQLCVFPNTVPDSSLSRLQSFFQHLDLPKDFKSARDSLRRRATLRNST